MYFRYFMWNFSGKQNDLQGKSDGNPRDGNWITGIPFIDSIFLGDQSQMPDSLKNNKAHNTLFALPFILGLIGMFYHFKRRGDDGLSNFLLFFWTGIAIILYLNQAGNQPRERDYAYTGSFYAFAVWIGLGVMKVTEWLSKKLTGITAASLATGICLLAVPVLMAQQEWDDHDRSKKVLPRDLAKDYLESCAPNAILFSFGDNDTYPLWYAQEVEGIRPDIRVINFSLLGIDWYINQLRYKVNNSDPIDVIWTADQIEGDKRNFVIYHSQPNIPENRFYDLYDIMKNYVGSDDPAKMDNSRGEALNVLPVRRVSLPVDKDAVRKNGTASAKDSVVDEVRFEIPARSLFKNDLAVLNIIAANAANKWQRPIYFTGGPRQAANLGFDNYLRRDGLSYRLVPVANDDVNGDWAYNNMMNKFGFGNANVKGVYYDEENRRHLLSIRSAYAELGRYLADKGKKDSARQVLEKADKMMLDENFPYGMTSIYNMHDQTSLMFLDACYRAGDTTLAGKVKEAVKKDLQQQIKYYNSLDEARAGRMAQERSIAESYLRGIEQMEQSYATKKPVIPETGKVIGGDTNKAKK